MKDEQYEEREWGLRIGEAPRKEGRIFYTAGDISEIRKLTKCDDDTVTVTILSLLVN
jgi:hypothetical protein